MRRYECDRCKQLRDGLYLFTISFDGAPRIGGASLTWDGRRRITQPRGRRVVELCSRCADGLVAAAGPALQPVPDMASGTGKDGE